MFIRFTCSAKLLNILFVAMGNTFIKFRLIMKHKLKQLTVAARTVCTPICYCNV